MKIYKFISIILIGILSLTFFAAYRMKNNNKTIIFVPQSLDDSEYWKNINENIRKSSEEAGYKYKRMGSKEWSSEKQAEAVKQAVKEKPSSIVIAPISDEYLFEAIRQANKAHIPIILVDSDIDRTLLAANDVYVSTFVGISNYDGGVQVADKVAEKLSSGDKVAILGCGADSDSGNDRCQGFKDEISKKGMNVVAELSTNWTKESGYEKGKLLMQAYPDLKAVFAINGTVFNGAEQAAQEYNVSIVGGTFDCDEDTLKQISKGKLICTFDQNSEGMAEGVVKAVDKLVNGEEVDSINTTEGKIIS